jgi:hypothetical protein
MTTSRFISIVAAFAAVTVVGLAQPQQQRERTNVTRHPVKVAPAPPEKKIKPVELDRLASKLSVTPAAKHANLEIYLLEGDDQFDTKEVLTLDEALGKKDAVKVKETKEVNELTVANKDAKRTVFIMAGDIVKGGQQDRTLGTDLPLAAKSPETPVQAFCVEHGRWSARKGEKVTEFSSSKNAIVSKEGKLAVRSKKDQGAVWESVSKAQGKLSGNLSTTVNAPASPSSLQLALENDKVKTTTKEYADALRGAVEKNPRAVGFVSVINGEINSGEIFAGHDLFRRVWPKLLDASATEAIAEKDQPAAKTAATVESVRDFLAKSEEAQAQAETLQGALSSVSAETDETALFQTIDEEKQNRWLRRSVIKK